MNEDPDGFDLNSLKQCVDELYHFRDHYFEENSIENAARKKQQVDRKLQETVQVLTSNETKAVKENKSIYYYLKGK